MEIWADVVGYEGRYKVSSTGRVVSLNYHRERRMHELRPCRDSDGYLKVLLYDGKGGRAAVGVHRLVAAAFIPGDNSLQVNHIDGAKDNNEASNLEWVTAGENLVHSFERLGREVASGAASKVAKYYVVTSPDGQETTVKGLNAFCKANGLLQGEMTNVVSGRAKSHRKWRCRHATDSEIQAYQRLVEGAPSQQ